VADPLAEVAARVLTYHLLADSLGRAHGVDPALILAVIHNESGGDPDAFPENPARDGASFGLMQVELPTARGLGFKGSARLLFDPQVSMLYGTLDLAGGIHDYGTEYLACIDYNGGPHAVGYYRAGWRLGPAVHYANVVFALRDYYRRRLAVLAAAPPAAAPAG